MKHQIILWTGALLLLMVGVMGCEKEKETNAEETFFSNLQKAPHDIMAKKDFPDWLSEKVNQMEKENKKDIAIVKIRLYQGEWNEKTVYFVKNYLSSCLFCEVYYDGGKRVAWSKEYVSTDHFCHTSKDWKLIYEYGNGVY